MPVPVNLTPATALVIAALPYTHTIVAADLALTPAGTGYASTCDALQRFATWYRYTTGPSEITIAVTAQFSVENDGDAGVSIWTGTPPGLTQYSLISAGSTQRFCQTFTGGFWMQVPVQPSTTYYFQVTNHHATVPAGEDLIVQVRAAPVAAMPAGSFLITDDKDYYQSTVLSRTTGDVLGIRQVPAGEYGATLPSGELCLQNGQTGDSIVILAADLTTIATQSVAPSTVQCIKSDFDATFYVLTRLTPADPIHVFTISKTGVVGPTTWILPANSIGGTRVVAAVNRAGTILYYSIMDALNLPIYAYDLVTSVALPDLHAGFGATHSLFGMGDGTVAADGTIWFGYRIASINGCLLRQFNAAGSLLQTIDTTTLSSAIVTANHYVLDLDSVQMVVWGYQSDNSLSTFLLITLATGALASELNDVPTNFTSGDPQATPFAIANSCALIVVPHSIPLTSGFGAPATVTDPIRMVRRFSLANDKRLWLTIHRLEVELQRGVGLSEGQGSDPQVMLRVSRDGGMTWSPSRWMSAGKMGAYLTGVYSTRFGRSKDWVCELVFTDPVLAAWSAVFIDVEEGSN